MFSLKKSIRLQVEKLITDGVPEQEAKTSASLMKEIREMLLKWESGEKEVIESMENDELVGVCRV